MHRLPPALFSISTLVVLSLFTSSVYAVAATPSARDPGKVALLPLACERGVEPEICEVLGDSIALAIAKASGLQAITPGDLELMMGAHALSELSNCGGDTCFVGDEALRIDAAWLIGGTITRLGDNTRVVMRLVDLGRGAIIDRGEVTVGARDEEALDEGVRELSLRLLSRRGVIALPDTTTRQNAVVVQEEPPVLLYAGAGTTALGVIVLGSAGLLGSLAYLDVESARTAANLGEHDAFTGHASNARMKAWGADVLLTAGGAIVIGGVVMAIVGAL